LLSQILLPNQARYALEANRFFTYPLKQDVSLSSDLEVFLRGVAIFLFGSGSPSLGCPIHIRSSTV